MEELKVLRDITLFYHERHPELRGTGSTRRPAEEMPLTSTRQQDTRVASDGQEQEPEMTERSDLEDITQLEKK